VLVTHSNGDLIAIERPSTTLPLPQLPLLLDKPDPDFTVVIGDPDPLDPLEPIIEPNPNSNYPLVKPGSCSSDNKHLCLLGLHPIVCEVPTMVHDDNGSLLSPAIFFTNLGALYPLAGICVDKDAPIRLLPSPDDVNLPEPWYHFDMSLDQWTIGLGAVAALAVFSNVVRLAVGIIRGKPMAVPGGDPKPSVKSPKKGKVKAKKNKEKSKDPAIPPTPPVASPVVEQKTSIISADGKLRIGIIEMDTKKVLGLGSSGTVVYEGGLNGRKVAIKRMLKVRTRLDQTKSVKLKSIPFLT